jgi:hypothetical protein
MYRKLPPLTSTSGLYDEVATIVSNAGNIWGWTHRTTTPFKIRLPGKVSVIVGEDRFVVERFLLDDWPAFACTGDVVHTNHASKAFPYILTWLKLRWMLKLHSAMVELDSKLCSCKRLIQGILYVIIQQYAQLPTDSVFQPKMSAAGAFLNIDMLLDDIIEQMQKFFGKGFGAFVQYVMSCDPSRSLIVSTVDLSLPRIGSNAKLERMVDCIYFAYLVKLPPSVRILDVLVDFEAFQLPIPTIPNVGIEVLHAWLTAKSHVTQNELLKSAQKQAIEFTAALELGMIRKNQNLSSFNWKQIFQVICELTSHWYSFPQALRERLLANIPQIFELEKEELSQLHCFAAINRDEPLLSKEEQDRIKESELARLKYLAVHKNYRTEHCLLPSIVAPPALEGQPALFTRPLPFPAGGRLDHPEGTTGGEYMGPKGFDPRPKFRVPQNPGPYTWDADVGRFRSQGVFSKSGNLGFD